jgi:hypothetical protein
MSPYDFVEFITVFGESYANVRDKFPTDYIRAVGRDSVVGIATRYELDGPGI